MGDDADDDGYNISDLDTEPGDEPTPEITMQDLLKTGSLDVDLESPPISDSVLKSVQPASIDNLPEVSPIGLKRGYSSTHPIWLEQAFASSAAVSKVKGFHEGKNPVQYPSVDEQATSNSCKQNITEHQAFSTCDIWFVGWG